MMSLEISISVELNSLYQHLICTDHVVEKKSISLSMIPYHFFQQKVTPTCMILVVI